jgi:hypothetical protein
VEEDIKEIFQILLKMAPDGFASARLDSSTQKLTSTQLEKILISPSCCSPASTPLSGEQQEQLGEA